RQGDHRRGVGCYLGISGIADNHGLRYLEGFVKDFTGYFTHAQDKVLLFPLPGLLPAQGRGVEHRPVSDLGCCFTRGHLQGVIHVNYWRISSRRTNLIVWESSMTDL